MAVGASTVVVAVGASTVVENVVGIDTSPSSLTPVPVNVGCVVTATVLAADLFVDVNISVSASVPDVPP